MRTQALYEIFRRSITIFHPKCVVLNEKIRDILLKAKARLYTNCIATHVAPLPKCIVILYGTNILIFRSCGSRLMPRYWSWYSGHKHVHLLQYLSITGDDGLIYYTWTDRTLAGGTLRSVIGKASWTRLCEKDNYRRYALLCVWRTLVCTEAFAKFRFTRAFVLSSPRHHSKAAWRQYGPENPQPPTSHYKWQITGVRADIWARAGWPGWRHRATHRHVPAQRKSGVCHVDAINVCSAHM